LFRRTTLHRDSDCDGEASLAELGRRMWERSHFKKYKIELFSDELDVNIDNDIIWRCKAYCSDRPRRRRGSFVYCCWYTVRSVPCAQGWPSYGLWSPALDKGILYPYFYTQLNAWRLTLSFFDSFDVYYLTGPAIIEHPGATDIDATTTRELVPRQPRI
jgi:hypothetical protein